MRLDVTKAQFNVVKSLFRDAIKMFVMLSSHRTDAKKSQISRFAISQFSKSLMNIADCYKIRWIHLRVYYHFLKNQKSVEKLVRHLQKFSLAWSVSSLHNFTLLRMVSVIWLRNLNYPPIRSNKRRKPSQKIAFIGKLSFASYLAEIRVIPMPFFTEIR